MTGLPPALSVCPLTTGAVLARAVAIGGDLPAVVGPDDRVSWTELGAEVEALRNGLHALGVRRGDHVALCLGNGPRWVAVFLAVTSLGAVAVPVNTRLRRDEVAHVLRQSRSRFLIAADRVLSTDVTGMLTELLPDGPGAGTTLPDLAAVVVRGADLPPGAVPWGDLLAAHPPTDEQARPEDVALIQYTSGTISAPKGVRLRHSSICANAFHSGLRVGLRAGDRFFSCRPFFHVAGTTLSLLACAQHVSALVTAERFEAGTALAMLEQERCTHFSGNETIALMLLDHPDRRHRRLHLRGAWLAAAPAVVARVVDELGAAEAVVGYGLSEASPNVAQSAWWQDRAIRVDGAMDPQPGVEVRVVDPADRTTSRPYGEAGLVLVRGWNVMVDYFELPDRTAEALDADGWLDTGDLGSLDAHGRLTFRGRLKEIIRVGGENVSPAEVEDLLHTHPGVQQAVVVGVPDNRLVEVAVAVVQPRPGATLDPDELVSWAAGRIAGFKAPRRVFLLADLSVLGMTESGKYRRADVTAWVLDRTGAAS